MFCTRCQRNVPDILWVGKDHPVLTDQDFIVRRSDQLEDNTVRITAEMIVEMRMCSDVFQVISTLGTSNG